ncbi:hypothetical protein [Paenibacillus sp. L3-i20]|uniref:hypothetical protein n=1 Tax=Paenibacillus sp. L3-i20 TaxID=2905833 RepID=UPI001EDEA4B6|nr:hypothetical protein [Paenibacillus sp. L3-i20]GKU78258.1 hypothetical protein L3i20_v226550 [Paenibacillus sp. L3-i20]
MESKSTLSHAKSQLAQLFQDAGYKLPGLVAYIDELEQRKTQLEQENSKLKSASARRTTPSSMMNSKLMDALRE